MPDCFQIAEHESEFRQGEILTGVRQFDYDIATTDAIVTEHSWSVICHQDCDLLQDFRATAEGRATGISSILLLPLTDINTFAANASPGIDRNRVDQNREERFHTFQPIAEQHDLHNEPHPKLVCDFKRIFSVPPRQLYYQVGAGSAKRRAILTPPYKEHFQSRFAFYLQRVALPD